MNKIKSNKFYAESFASFVFYFTVFMTSIFLSNDVSKVYWYGGLSSVVLFLVTLFFYKVSGCHINPIISFSLFVRKKISFKEFWQYFLSQIIAAFVAALLAFGIYSILNIGKSFSGLVPACSTFGSTGTIKASFVAAIIVEFILSFVFVTVYLVSSKKSKSNLMIALFISISFFIIIIFGYYLTSACINPIKSIVSAIIFGLFSRNYTAVLQIPIYVIVPILASFCSAKTCNVFFHRKTKENKENIE